MELERVNKKSGDIVESSIAGLIQSKRRLSVPIQLQ